MLKKIGKYDITEELGSGGYSRVYRAFDPNVGRPVAIKVSTRASDPEHLSRFKNEASAAGNLRHKNIVTIFDYGDDSGVAYVVMELLNGVDLHKLTQATRKPTLLEKMQIMTQVAEGLHCAHVNGVVHRDIKPPNVMVLPDGSVKILDFGVARFTGGSGRLTQNGFLVGTPLYMSPEQLKGHDADPLSDIWGYGVLYFELLTGQHPFLAQDNARLIRNITQLDAPPVQTLAHLVPDSLSDVIRRMLTRDRARRYQSFEEVLVDTNPILAELEQTEVGKLLEEAQSLRDKGQYVQAQRSARRILELDTRNFRALQLLKTVQLKLKEQPPTPQPSEQPAPQVVAKVPATKAFQLEMMAEAADTVEFVRDVEPENVLHPQVFFTAEPAVDPTPRPKTPEPKAITPLPTPVAIPETVAVLSEPVTVAEAVVVPEPVAALPSVKTPEPVAVPEVLTKPAALPTPPPAPVVEVPIKPVVPAVTPQPAKVLVEEQPLVAAAAAGAAASVPQAPTIAAATATPVEAPMLAEQIPTGRPETVFAEQTHTGRPETVFAEQTPTGRPETVRSPAAHERVPAIEGLVAPSILSFVRKQNTSAAVATPEPSPIPPIAAPLAKRVEEPPPPPKVGNDPPKVNKMLGNGHAVPAIPPALQIVKTERKIGKKPKQKHPASAPFNRRDVTESRVTALTGPIFKETPKPARRVPWGKLGVVFSAVLVVLAALFFFWPSEPPPVLTLSPSILTFNWKTGGDSPDPEAIVLNGAARNMTFTAKSDSDWLVVTPSADADHRRWLVAVLPQKLKPKSYTGWVEVASREGYKSEAEVTLRVTTSDEATVQATPEDAAVRKQVEPPVAKKAPPKAAPKTAVIKKKPAPEQPIEIN